MSKPDQPAKPMSRREALERLAKLSAYTAPTVVALLTPSLSAAQGSALPPETPQCDPNTGAHYNGVLGANSNASVVGGDAANANPPGYWSPTNGWMPPGDGWSTGDHGEYNKFSPDTSADCGQ